MDELPPNVHCAWCKTPMGHKPDVPPGEISHGICPGCTTKYFPDIDMKELYHEIVAVNEDWTFEPTKDTQLPAMSARHTMTQLPGQKDDNLMKPYHFTSDPSSKKSEKIRKMYRNKNRGLAVKSTRLPTGF